jgi:hypothetical protein
VPEPREINFRSQQDFRRQLVGSLLAMGQDFLITPKRSISKISQGAEHVSVQLHKQVMLTKVGEYVNYKGLRFRDRPKKRLALGEIAANQGRESSRHESQYGCEQCNVHLCKKRCCFNVFHQ